MAQKPVIQTDQPGLVLVQMTTMEDDKRFFEWQNRNRAHIKAFGNRVYETVEEVTARRTVRIRFGIYVGDELVGSLDFVPSSDGTEAEAGISLSEDAVGHGYATAAFKAGALAVSPQFARIFAEVRPDNERSLKLCRRVGLVQRPGIVQREWGPALVFDYLKQA